VGTDESFISDEQVIARYPGGWPMPRIWDDDPDTRRILSDIGLNPDKFWLRRDYDAGGFWIIRRVLRGLGTDDA
jgi:hypothetical protein